MSQRRGGDGSLSSHHSNQPHLVRYELATGGRTVLSQDYEVGDYNEVVRIRTGEGPDVSYGYDSAGRLTAVQAGARTATVAYDDLDRAEEVGLDGATLATYDYARADADAALAADRITSATPVPSGTSAVFGTMETVVYTRPAPMHFGPVAYEPALRTFRGDAPPPGARRGTGVEPRPAHAAVARRRRGRAPVRHRQAERQPVHPAGVPLGELLRVHRVAGVGVGVGRGIARGRGRMLATAGLAQPIRETFIFDRDGVQFDLRGGCADQDVSGLWLLVRVRHSNKPSDTLEFWFVDVSGDDHSISVRVVSEIPMPRRPTVGCVTGHGTKLAWRLADRGKLRLHRISRDGLEPIAGELAGFWEYPVNAVRFVQGVLTFVAADAVGVLDLEAGTAARHERWTVAAWLEPGTGELYSVRSMGRIDDDADGFPPVALTREAVLPDGGLRLLATTEPWPVAQPVEEGSIEEIGFVNYNLAATRDKVFLLREHFMGTGRLRVSTWDKATLRDTRNFVVEIPSGSAVMDAVAVAGEAVAAVPKYSDGSESVRLLHIDQTGCVRESAAPPVHGSSRTLLDFELFDVGRYIVAVATQSISHPNGEVTRPVTIDVFDVQAAP